MNTVRVKTVLLAEGTGIYILYENKCIGSQAPPDFPADVMVMTIRGHECSKPIHSATVTACHIPGTFQLPGPADSCPAAGNRRAGMDRQKIILRKGPVCREAEA